MREARASHSACDPLRTIVNIQTISTELQTRLRRQLELKDELLDARARLETARTTEVVLPEGLDEEGYLRALASALAEPGASEPEPAEPSSEPLADELTPADLGELFGVSEMTIRRWRAGTSNPPIDPGAWIQVSARDWRYPVSAIDERAVARIPADEPVAALDAIRRRRASLSFGRKRHQVTVA